MDMNKLNEPNTGASELQRRRSRAQARHDRENERKTLLCALIAADRQARHLRSWIADRKLHLDAKGDGELDRMLQWAGNELVTLETMAEPAYLAETLRRAKLFPEVDDLADPLGDPPPLRPWGR